MQHRVMSTVLIALALLLPASLSLAVESKAGAAEAKAAGKAKAVEKSAATGKAAAKQNLVDINSASKAELMKLPGISEEQADKIIAGRPYANKTQLKSRNILPAPVYEQVKDKIIAKQPKK